MAERCLVAVAVLVSACGGLTHLSADAGSDASSSDGASVAPDTSTDAFTSVTSDDVNCAADDYFVQVIDDGGVHSLSAGCGDAGAPTASMGGCSDKVLCLYVVACGSGSIQLASIDGWSPGSHFVVASYEPADASVTVDSYSGTIVVTDWPDAGGTVAGEYSVQSEDAGNLTGAFCVLRR